MCEILTPKQKQALEYMIKGENIFLTGPSGTGKSLVINMFKERFSHRRKIGITSTTGMSAILIGGTTIHSFLGIGLGNASVENLVKNIKTKPFFKKRWVELDTLIIDEVSMLSPELFDKLEEIARILRRKTPKRMLKEDEEKELPFGGIQLILTGDFLQLPVVRNDNFCFESKSWKKCVNNVINLTDIMRQTDIEFQNILNEIRYGIVSDNTRKILESRIKKPIENKLGIKPTKIFTTNSSTDELNTDELEKLEETDIYQYDMVITINGFHKDELQVRERIKKNCIATEQLQLCKNAQVMLLHNLDLEVGLANGSRGIVKGFIDDKPLVCFVNGEERVIDHHVWEITECDKTIATVCQIPLKLAWAITVHKCVNANTLIPTEYGLNKISELSDKNTHKQLENSVIDSEFNILSSNGWVNQCSQIYKGYIEDTIKITTSLGYTIEGSLRHPILVNNNGKEEWKKLPEIKIGDTITLKNNTDRFANHFGRKQNIEDDVSYLLGYIHKYPSFTKLPEYIYRIIGCKDRDINCKQCKDKLCYTSKYNIPKVVREGGTECQKSYLQGLFDRYGVVSKKNIYLKQITFSLCQQLQVMLLNFSIITKRKFNRLYICSPFHFIKNIGFHYNNLKYNLSNDYFKNYNLKQNDCKVPNGKNIIKIIKSLSLGFFIPQNEHHNIKRITNILNENIEPNYYDFRYIMDIHYFTNDNIQILFENDKIFEMYFANLFYDKVCKIEYNRSQVYDLYVPGVHNFVGNGIINHNSQGCTLDCAEVNLKNVFTHGQSYVALSRVKSKEGLNIEDIDFNRIKAHPKAVEYYKSFE